MTVIFNKVCIICNKPFSTVSNVRATCSDDCRSLQRKAVRTLWYKNNAKRLYAKYRDYHLKYSTGRQIAYRLFHKLKIKMICEKCNSSYKVEIHHIDFNPNNNRFANLTILCKNCHYKAHHQGIGLNGIAS